MTRSGIVLLAILGCAGLHLLKTAELMLPDGEGTVDGTHPNAWSAHQMAEGFVKSIRQILSNK